MFQHPSFSLLEGRATVKSADPGNIHPLDACLLTPRSSQPSDESTTRNSFPKPTSGLFAQSYHTRSLRLQLSIFHRSSDCRAGQAADLVGERKWSSKDPRGNNSRRQSFAWTHLHTCAPHERRAVQVGRPFPCGEAVSSGLAYTAPAPFLPTCPARSWRGTNEMDSKFI